MDYRFNAVGFLNWWTGVNVYGILYKFMSWF